ncbi:MAG: 2-amino-4-hydroxy-6-hydroxymethyldihydropteridine diphosphokinase [Ferruginibacter sp.]
MNKTYLLLGSNLGNSIAQLEKAKKYIAQKIGNIKRSSGIYQTKAWGKTDQPDFFNQVIVVETKLDAAATMHCILSIEAKMGRIRDKKNDPRIIDIDILFFNKEICQTPLLTLPHPLIQERNFVLIPLNELSPSFIHPVLKQTIHQLMLRSKDQLAVKKN